MSTRRCSHPLCEARARPRRKQCDEHSRRRTGARPSRAPRVVYLALSAREWEALYESQGRACAICQSPLMNRYAPGSTEGKLAYLDHDHALEKKVGLRGSIRGLLCLWCNRHILIALHDSPDKAQRAADYLLTPPARRLFGLDLLVPLGDDESGNAGH